MIQNQTLIVLSSVLSNGDNSNAKKLLVQEKLIELAPLTLFEITVVIFLMFIIILDLFFDLLYKLFFVR